MEQALSNPLILHKIIERFARTGSNELKNLRLVATNWNEAVVSLLGANLVLNVNPDVEPRGAGRFHIFGCFVSQLGHLIEHLSILISADMGQILHTFFLKFNLPNLKELVVTINDRKTLGKWKAHIYASRATVTGVIPTKLKLAKILYNAEFKSEYYATTSTQEQQFLENVKFSLERLELNVGVAKFPSHFNFDRFKDIFHLPRGGLPKLKSFVNGALRIFKSTIPEVGRMGKLKKLDLCEIPDVAYPRASIVIGDIVTLGRYCWRDVTDLRLCGLESPDLLVCLASRFPSLKKLSVTVSECKTTQNKNFLLIVFKKLATLPFLTHVAVVAPFPTEFPQLVDFLQYLPQFSPDITQEIRVSHYPRSFPEETKVDQSFRSSYQWSARSRV
ncbi:hypothetical protein Fcan01_25438 [Folsomia candida]|uniref:Uncharacterized protein n=1 Tax=Folsomia candida TaxID=158441 RepID=A0A226D4B5_FOLCA|nr:hypothetical protein Fcan01_25438 [Folsomia candida]